MRQLSTATDDFSAQWAALKHLPANEKTQNIEAVVRDIIQRVRTEGESALRALTQHHDRWSAINGFDITREECEEAWARQSAEMKETLSLAHQRILTYHQKQLPTNLPYTVNILEDGGSLRYRQQALTRVALYVPGGLAAYPSSVLMNAIPAKVAGVQELIMLTPTPDGLKNDTVLAVAHLCGINRVLALGGAQAIAAVAYGTESIPQCDKIVGPGNAYVAEAKRQVFGQMGIDMIAGPSEVFVISDGQGNPMHCAADLMAQAEHDEWAQSILATPSKGFIQAVSQAINHILPDMPRRDTIRASLANRGALIHTRTLDEAVDLCNQLAPEHVIVATNDPEAWVDKIRYAGGIFLGHDSCEVFGDYCAGTNHVLPTYGSARFASPLSVHDFLKGTAILGLSPATVKKIAPHAVRMAQSEGLHAHALSAQLRLG